MGFWDKIFGNKVAEKAATGAVADERADGWDAIDQALAKVYPNQEPKHFAHRGVAWSYDLSGKAEPLHGVHVFDGGDFWHYVGLGLSELFGKDSKDPQVSGLGYEFTFRLVKGLAKNNQQELPPGWPIDLMNGLGRPAKLGNLVFSAGHTVETGPFDSEGYASSYVGVLMIKDSLIESTATPHGHLDFLQLVPVDAETLGRAQNGNARKVAEELAALDPNLAMRES